jgi:hypothetical protein
MTVLVIALHVGLVDTDHGGVGLVVTFVGNDGI